MGASEGYRLVAGTKQGPTAFASRRLARSREGEDFTKKDGVGGFAFGENRGLLRKRASQKPKETLPVGSSGNPKTQDQTLRPTRRRKVRAGEPPRGPLFVPMCNCVSYAITQSRFAFPCCRW